MAVHRSTLAEIRQWTSRMLDDCILATVSSGDTEAIVLATTDPVQFYNKGDDYFNQHEYECYCYGGTNIGTKNLCYDWTIDDHTLTVTPAAASNYGTSSTLEFHRIFTSQELLYAINLAIHDCAEKYYFDIDDTSITLVESTGNAGTTIYTYEYDIPTDYLAIHTVTIEGYVGGIKLTGTVSGAFTLGETITGDSSGATGVLSYGPSGGTYILVREVDGTFTVGETAEGGTSEETCSTITAVDNETVGNGQFPKNRELDDRDWDIMKATTSKLRFDSRVFGVIADLRVQIEGQGGQAAVSADTDYIYLPPVWVCQRAITYLPFSKVESNNLLSTFQWADSKSTKVPIRALRGKEVIA